MGAFRRAREGDRAPRQLTAAGVGGRVASALWRVTLSLVVIAAGTLALLYLMLLRGPISIPGAAEWVAEEAGAALEDKRVEIGDVVLALGQSGEHTGVQLLDVRILTADGDAVLAIPRIGGRVDLSDLITGRFRPIEIVLAGPEARLVRDAGGRYLLGLGAGGGVVLDDPGDARDPESAGAVAAADESTLAIVLALIDGFASHSDPAAAPGALPDALGRLQRVRIVDARLAYNDHVAGAEWTSDDAMLEIARIAGGARLRLEARVTPAAGGPPTRVALNGLRLAGEEESRLELRFSDARPADVATQVPALEWLDLIDAPLDGRLNLVIGDGGAVHTLSGRLAARAGRLVPDAGEALEITGFSADFRLDDTAERLWIEAAKLDSVPVTARVGGVLDLERDERGELWALVAQVDVGALRLVLPETFDRIIAFDAGRITGRLRLEPLTFEIGEARLVRGDLTIEATGRARSGDDGWRTDLRVAASQVPVEDLVGHWPLFAAENPRTWIAERMKAGVIDTLIAHVRLGRGEPEVAMDFSFHDATALYVPTMPPITAATGRGHLAGNRFALALTEGAVQPAGGAPIGIGGSTFAIPDVTVDIPLGEVDLIAAGGLDDVLDLIDTPPLGLLSRLGADLGTPEGRAEVRALVAFPLLKDLAIDEVEADVTATMTDLRLAPVLGSAGRVAVSAARAELAADDAGMRIAGRAVIDGQTLDLAWTERFGGARGRSIALDGTAGREWLGKLVPGIGEVMRAGNLPLHIELGQSGAGATTFSVRADLGPVAIAVPALLWSKGVGAGGRLTAEGSFGDRLEITAFRIAAGDFDAEGRLALTAAGALDRLTIRRLVLGKRADLGVEVWIDAAGAIRARVAGSHLDLTEFIAEGSGGDDDTGGALRAELNLDRLLLSDNLVLSSARGEYIRTERGQAQARIDGQVAGGAGVQLTYYGGTGRDDRLLVTSDDAGAVLASAGYFDGGTGGTMLLEALIAPVPGVEAQGILRIEDMQVRQAPTLSAMLTSGDAADLSAEVSSGGLRFREIEVPFVYGSGRLALRDVIATSPSLAVKVEGIYDETTDRVDLHGVLSPAYAVTGVLDRIPLLGTILSGGEGEGIFAMTFTVEGPASDPTFEVQPLSLLAPGILRRIFSGGGGGSSLSTEEFMERISRPER